MASVRCFVKVDGELVHEESFVVDTLDVSQVSYPGLNLMGRKYEVGFEFDPPLTVPPPMKEPE